MNQELNIEERIPIWVALSEFYLDTELQDSGFRHIANKVIESPYTFGEVKTIDKYEVFPVLQPNLLNVAGEWAAFDEKWLVSRIVASIEKRNKAKNMLIEGAYKTLKHMHNEHWVKLEMAYSDLRQ